MFEVAIFIIGSVIGSFLNVCIYRMPKGESIIFPSSHCPECKHSLAWWENVPIVSFILLKGRCNHCNAPISWRYPLVELLTALTFLIVYLKFYKLPIDCVFYFIFVSALIVITFIDLKHFLILDKITYPLMTIGLLFSIVSDRLHWKESIAGLLIGAGIILFFVVVSPFIFKKEGMGGGDVKLTAAIGAFLGWKKVLLVIFLSSLIGACVGILLISLHIKKRTDYLPYGPYLALASFITLLWGDNMINFYFSQIR